MRSVLIERHLQATGIQLPKVPRPIANFRPWQRHGNLVYLAGQVCEWNGEVVFKGKVGDAIDLVSAQRAARICALNLVAALREALDGDLDRVTACVRVAGFVNCTPDFDEIAQVIDGASDCLHELFGPGMEAHARTAIGVGQLPQGASVEVDAIFAVG